MIGAIFTSGKLMFQNIGTLLKAAMGDKTGIDKLLDEMFFEYND